MQTFKWALALATTVLMAACGGGDEASATAPAAATPAAQTSTRAKPLALSAGAQIAPEEAARQLMDYAQQQFPAYFPGQTATAALDPFVYRYYAATGIALGVVVKASPGYVPGSVYVMGGPFGATPSRVGSVNDFITPVAPGFDMTPAADKVVVVQGSSSTLRVNLARTPGFEDAVQLRLQGLPAGVTATLATVPAGATFVDVTIQAQASAPHSLPTPSSVQATAGSLLAVAPITVTVRGRPGELDTSFAGGAVSTSLGASEDYAHAVAVQADGRLLSVGTTATSAGTVVGLVRHLRDGTLDPSFGNGGKVVTQVGARGDSARAIAVQPDGKIVVVGWTDQTGTDANFLVLRYLDDGSLDPAFAQGGKLVVPFGSAAGTDRAHAVAIQDDGKIVVAGAAQPSGSATGQDFALIRLLPDGTLDAGFGTGGKVLTPMQAGNSGDVVYGLALPRVGGEQRILAVGGEGDFMAARYTASGALDASFGSGGKVVGLFKRNVGNARAVTLLPGGGMLLAGGIYNDFAAAQLTESGALDSSFGNGGLVVHAVSASNWDNAHAVVRQADGKLVLGGWAYSGKSTSGDFVAMRLLSDGALDASFGTAGIVIHSLAANGRNDSARGMVLQADERISTVRAVLAGEISAGAHDFGLIRLWL